MPINNLNNTHLTDAQKESITSALSQLEAALEPLTVSLTPDERKRYGSVNELHKLLINKVRDYRRDSETLSDPETDWEEFERDYTSRTFLESIINRLNACGEKLSNAKILHDYDNYQTALDDYGFTSYKAGSNKPGFETKMNELKQFFTRSKTANPPLNEQSEPLK